MAAAEKTEIYKRKKAFIDDLSNTLRMRARMAVMQVDYEVYRKTENNGDHFEEFLVVVYNGGGEAVRCISEKSNLATYIEIEMLLDDGYYDELPRYKALAEEGFTKINLED